MTDWTIISLGNRFRGDDAVGPYVVDRLRAKPGEPPACIENGGDMPQLVEDWRHRQVILVDALQSDRHEPGSLLCLDGLKETIPPSLCMTSSHGLNLGEALELSRLLDALPEKLTVYAVCGREFSTGAPISPAVRAAAEKLVQKILIQIATEAGPHARAIPDQRSGHKNP
ncbi:hydrogenase maturation protease [Microbulbifer guangxiensis]|uniref:hydrogenase maturation protease n=1 Tax=Microbulbifer guangxiensis TaxID=2904249 RepID=UPI001F1875E7|nr:hydrogenase maturation protease [Microbulbifer guangxiensis]